MSKGQEMIRPINAISWKKHSGNIYCLTYDPRWFKVDQRPRPSVMCRIGRQDEAVAILIVFSSKYR